MDVTHPVADKLWGLLKYFDPPPATVSASPYPGEKYLLMKVLKPRAGEKSGQPSIHLDYLSIIWITCLSICSQRVVLYAVSQEARIGGHAGPGGVVPEGPSY